MAMTKCEIAMPALVAADNNQLPMILSVGMSSCKALVKFSEASNQNFLRLTNNDDFIYIFRWLWD
jgi:adenosine/AMP kinase